MGRLMKTSRPVWCDEAENIETAAVVEIDGAEYRQTDGAEDKSQGMRASGHENPDGHDPMGMKNNPEGAE